MTIDRDRRRRELTAALYGRPLDRALELPGVWEDLEAEAADYAAGDRTALATPRMIEDLRALQRQQRQVGFQMRLFNSTDDVLIVPGFMGSALTDVGGRFGLIWIDPAIAFDTAQLSALRLGPFDPKRPT